MSPQARAHKCRTMWKDVRHDPLGVTMRRLMTITAKTLAFGALAVGFTAVTLIPQPGQAWAPQMVAGELEALRARGWEPCEPVINQLPAELQEEGVLADAGPAPMFDICEIRFATNIETEGLHWVAFHEACHLATMNEIHSDPAHESMEDPYHHHPLFLACLDQGPAERGGY